MEAAADAGPNNALERFFKFKQWNTSLRRDTLAGLTTFIVMSYIIFVNPSILGLEGKGLPFAAALTSTCLVAGVMTIIMGLFTNRAYAIAPGMGLNAAVAFSLVLGQGLSFESAMGLIFLEGVAITILVLTGFREAIFKAIPLSILGLEGKGLPFAAALTSTCLVAGVMTIIMGLFTNRAYAIAPGMGLNAVVAFSLVLGQGLSFESAMGLIFLEGVAITILVLT